MGRVRRGEGAHRVGHGETRLPCAPAVDGLGQFPRRAAADDGPAQTRRGHADARQRYQRREARGRVHAGRNAGENQGRATWDRSGSPFGRYCDHGGEDRRREPREPKGIGESHADTPPGHGSDYGVYQRAPAHWTKAMKVAGPGAGPQPLLQRLPGQGPCPSRFRPPPIALAPNPDGIRPVLSNTVRQDEPTRATPPLCGRQSRGRPKLPAPGGEYGDGGSVALPPAMLRWPGRLPLEPTMAKIDVIYTCGPSWTTAQLRLPAADRRTAPPGHPVPPSPPVPGVSLLALPSHWLSALPSPSLRSRHLLPLRPLPGPQPAWTRAAMSEAYPAAFAVTGAATTLADGLSRASCG